jgi:hypothetical protein
VAHTKSLECDANGGSSSSQEDEVSKSSLVSSIYPFPLSRIGDSSSSLFEAFTVPSI